MAQAFPFLSLLDSNDIIIAPATPVTTACGLAVIRISGTFLPDFFDKSLKPVGPMGPLSPRMATLVDIYDSNLDRILDRALVTFFPSPKSFTGESVLELSVHGNPRLVEKIINFYVSNYNLRPATAGEFTLRAFKNNKLTLSQIEGLDLLLHSTTQPLIELSQYILSGGLQDEFYELRSLFDEHMSSIDVLTDFSEDIGEDQGWLIFHSSWRKIRDSINKFHIRSLTPLDLLSKPTIVLFGPPNAGKSTFFNRLLGFDRAIVSTLAGTTRDYLKEEINIDNNSFFLIDTAGIRETDEYIERSGIEFSRANISSAFERVLLFSAINFNRKLFLEFAELHSPTLTIITHIDAVDFGDCLKAEISTISRSPVLFFNLLEDNLDVSEFKKRVLTDYLSYFTDRPILFERQRAEILSLFRMASEYSLVIESDIGTDLGVVSNKFSEIRSTADRLIGVVDVDKVLNLVFSNFCIGK